MCDFSSNDLISKFIPNDDMPIIILELWSLGPMTTAVPKPMVRLSRMLYCKKINQDI
jgi:hypothetical protein